MGSFSWTCAKTCLPILESQTWHTAFPEGCHASFLTADGVQFAGTFDGYGGVGQQEITNDHIAQIENGSAKLALSAFLETDENFDTLHKSYQDPGQGYFFDSAFLKIAFENGGFAAPEAYILAAHGNLTVNDALALSLKHAQALSVLLDTIQNSFWDSRCQQLTWLDPEENKDPLFMTVQSNGNNSWVLAKGNSCIDLTQALNDPNPEMSGYAIAQQLADENPPKYHSGCQLMAPGGDDLGQINTLASDIGEQIWGVLGPNGQLLGHTVWPYTALQALNIGHNDPLLRVLIAGKSGHYMVDNQKG